MVQICSILTREPSTQTGTFGKLTYGSFETFTCELPWLDNHPDTSCIPKGIYLCKWTLSPRLGKETYELIDVPNRGGIRIHSANYPHELLGCIALGSTKDDKGIYHSRDTVKAFEDLMKHEDFTLEIH